MSYLSYNRFISRYTIFNAHIKVDGNEKWAGFMGKKKNTVIQVLSAIVAMGGYFKFECVYFLCKNSIFPFLLVKAFWIGIVWTNRRSGVKVFLSVITAPIHCPKTLGNKILLQDPTLYKTKTCLSLNIKNPYFLYRNTFCCLWLTSFYQEHHVIVCHTLIIFTPYTSCTFPI